MPKSARNKRTNALQACLRHIRIFDKTVACMVYDRSLKIRHVNQAFLALLGLPAETVVGRTLDYFIKPLHGGTEAELEKALSRAGEPPLASPSFAALSQSMLGVALDPDDLAGWLQGAAAPASDGWQVDIEERAPDGTVRRITAIRADTVVKLAVDSFRRNPQ